MAFEVSAHHIVEHQTRQIAKMFKRSNPRPRAKAMGLKTERQMRRTTLPLIRSKTPGAIHLTNEMIEAMFSE